MSGLHVVRHDDVARYDIPTPLAREIGRFIVTWAHFENYLQDAISPSLATWVWITFFFLVSGRLGAGDP
jgi:hypothetical protein